MGDDCDTTCATHGLLCDEMSLYNHNGDVDTDEELLAIVSTLYTGSMNSYCGYSYGYYESVPLISQQGWCLGTASDRALSTFNCSTITTPINQQKRRFSKLTIRGSAPGLVNFLLC